MNITPSSTSKEIESLALCIHQLLNELPLTIRTRNSKGIRLEEGQVIDYEYSGPILEKVLQTGEKISETPETGPYKGIPVVVVPLIDDGKVIAAIGVVDITKGIYSDIKDITRRPPSIENRFEEEDH